jgi:hypothetical protein
MMTVCTGNILWAQDYQSPVVALYKFDAEFGGLRKVPFITVATETLEHIAGQVTSEEWRSRLLQHSNDVQTLQSVQFSYFRFKLL